MGRWAIWAEWLRRPERREYMTDRNRLDCMAFRGVLLPKTHRSTERLRRREHIGSIDNCTRYVSINKIIFMQPSEFLYNNSVKLVIPVLQFGGNWSRVRRYLKGSPF